MPIAVEQPKAGQMRVVLVDKPGSVQTVIRFYMPGPKADDANRIKLELLNTILGGSFTSRLNQNLREKNGYTYGARSSYAMSKGVGYMTASADVQAEVTGKALKEFLAEFARIRSGDVSEEEARKSRETNRIEIVQGFQGLNGVIGTAQGIEEKGRPFASLAADLAAMNSVKEGDLNGLSKGAIPLENAVLVLVGDRKLIEEQVKDLQLPRAQVLSVNGKSVE